MQLYQITDRLSYAHGSYLEFLQVMVYSGLDIIQIREKDLSSRKLYNLAVEIKKIVAGTKCRVYINNRVDIMLALDLDGVHLGWNSLPVSTVRRLVGPHKTIGVSTHAWQEIDQLVTLGVDYVTLSPIFASSCKPNTDELGLDHLSHAAQRQMPVYALGGVTLEHLPRLVKQNIAGVAFIGMLQNSDNPAAAILTAHEIIKDNNQGQ